MNSNVTSFLVAIGLGYEPGLYTYDPKQIPIGEYNAILDFKIWSKRIIAINCYFTQQSTDKKFQVTVYCNNKTGRYEVPGSAVNFLECETGAIFSIAVEKSSKERIILTKANYISSRSSN